MIFRKIRTRWSEAGESRWDDYFWHVPRWLRIKRFLREDRTEKQLWRQSEEDYKEWEWERGGE